MVTFTGHFYCTNERFNINNHNSTIIVNPVCKNHLCQCLVDEPGLQSYKQCVNMLCTEHYECYTIDDNTMCDTSRVNNRTYG